MKLVVRCQLFQPPKFLSNTKHGTIYEEVMTELFVEAILRKCEIDLVSKGCQTTYFIHKCNHNHLQNLSKNAYINIICKTNNFALGYHRFTAP